MNIKAIAYGVTHDSNDFPVLHLRVAKGYEHTLSCIPEYDEYSIDIKKWKNNRSKRQNRLMWALLEIMSDEMNGGIHDKDSVTSFDCYISMLELAGAKYEVIACSPKALEMVKTQYRATKVIDTKTLSDEDGNKGQYVILKCYIGSSQFSTTEMTRLIDRIIHELLDMGIDERNQEDFASIKHESEDMKR